MIPMLVDGRALVTQLGIGDTPLVPLKKVTTRGAVWLKAEYANPFGSAKDRTAAYLLASARATVGANVSVVESTSGNLGIALARIGHRIRVPVTLVMDGSLPPERIADVRHAGGAVRVVHEPRAGLTMRETRIAVALELGVREGWLWVNQYANDSCVQAHRETTGPEMVASLRGDIDIVVASVGTGGTLCGISAAFRDLGQPALFVGVEPVGSTISGGTEGDYLPAGSGMRGMPEIVRRHSALIDLFAKVPDRIAAAWVRTLRNCYGLAVGLTTGAATAVACMLADEHDVRVVAVAPDAGTSFRTAVEHLCRAHPAGGGQEIDIRPFRESLNGKV